MWQRIQSLYLILFAVVFILLVFMKIPMGKLKDFNESVEQAAVNTSFEDGLFSADDHMLIIFIVLFGSIIATATIFLFKNRSLQSKMSRILIFVSVLTSILAFFLIYRDIQLIQELKEVQFSPALGAFIPMIGLILAWLAKNSIEKDDKLVRSMDRLR